MYYQILNLEYLSLSPDYITKSLLDSGYSLGILWAHSVLHIANCSHGIILLWISSALQKWLAQIPWLHIGISYCFLGIKINLLQSCLVLTLFSQLRSPKTSDSNHSKAVDFVFKGIYEIKSVTGKVRKILKQLFLKKTQNNPSPSSEQKKVILVKNSSFLVNYLLGNLTC